MVAPCLRPQRGGNPRPVAELGPPPEAMEAMEAIADEAAWPQMATGP
ncbi:MAG: hypothetical protein OSA36_07155 [Acidimicrobiales bacterium]|nr:hypothetical protein [Acidimicrobiales bacterium]